MHKNHMELFRNKVTSCRQEFHHRCVLEWRKLEVKWSTRVI
ncbi:hypothetical protein BDA96_03G195900 [Sorghum bicolor]|uniref:Uncharacterized protein n=1 Tax=Sorghum bicolor TaxID=4558 RepID=A0A921RDR9_SORBI|nr:hypothetical protein BDA96_05G178300 [Sorghum bicolor]KAG0537979.1 hypothetical protein BDA96_03G195900 [Sorghum bicolor]